MNAYAPIYREMCRMIHPVPFTLVTLGRGRNWLYSFHITLCYFTSSMNTNYFCNF